MASIPFYVCFLIGDHFQAKCYAEILKNLKDDSYKSRLIEINKEYFNET
eukprot:CAMPEP_0170554000 /NCGR_PEP_ID=MMETSP0211-20121228/11853_1 /TAXON_ID=311385 /ORGANISM="Pseudokeronopsis sp., Strain OXSARD2" /LENGTH=48 /DNA_ID= /DNA_START= /DNA_END= /DNA_ORIENTATION=